MSNPPSRILTTLGVLLGAVGGAAAASAMYGWISVQRMSTSIFRTPLQMLVFGVAMIPLFTFAGAAAGGLLVRRISPLLGSRSGGPSSPSS